MTSLENAAVFPNASISPDVAEIMTLFVGGKGVAELVTIIAIGGGDVAELVSDHYC